MSYYVSELSSDSVEMNVVSVQTPAVMWLVDATSKRITRRYYELEEFLKEEYKEKQLFTRMFNVGDVVGVYDSATGAWCRGKICDIYPTLSKYDYTVFLLDRGHSITVSDVNNIRELPSDAKVMRFRCYHVQLFGIFPVSPEYGITRPDNIALQAWLPAAMDAVTDLLNTCEAVYFTSRVGRKVVYGDMHLKFDNFYVDLADYLCDNNFAFRDNVKFYREMETAPLVCKETRTVLQNIEAMEKRNTEQWDGMNPSNDFQPVAIPANKLPEGNKFSANKSKEGEKEMKPVGLAEFCEEMAKRKKKPSSLLRDDQIGVSASLSPERNLGYIGRGERLKMLNTWLSERKPGGNSIDMPGKHDSLNDQLTMIKKLSLNETNDSAEETGKIFEPEDTVSNQRKVKSYNNKRCEDHTAVMQCNSQTLQTEKVPKQSYTIFARPRPVVYIPAGAESSMLCPVRKKPEAKKNKKYRNY